MIKIRSAIALLTIECGIYGSLTIIRRTSIIGS